MATKLTVNRGTTYAITVNYTENGVATSIVGATIYFTVKSVLSDTDAADATAVISKNVTSFSNGAGGIAVITLTNTDTYQLPATYFYDIKIKKADGTIYLLQEGSFIIQGSPTNRTT